MYIQNKLWDSLIDFQPTSNSATGFIAGGWIEMRVSTSQDVH